MAARCLSTNPEILLLTSHFETAMSVGKVPGWSYDAANAVLIFDWYGIRRVWKRTGQTRIIAGAEYTVFHWPD
jgi:hypothetical protein